MLRRFLWEGIAIIKTSAHRPQETRTKVNGCTYIVRSYFKESARETAEQKMLRLISERVSVEAKKTEEAVFRSK